MRFAVDGMLGRLARWLRLTGHDVIYVNELALPPDAQDDFLLEQGRKGRILVTSDKLLYRKSKREGIKAVLVSEGRLIDQLSQLARNFPEFDINLEESRCPLCNGELEEVGRKEVEGEVPDGVLKLHDIFWRCVKCGKIYWEGTHWKNIMQTLEEFGERRKWT